jgi:quercetin dioxygenase-like cupin family protein
MSLRNAPLLVGDLRGMIYTFEVVGDTLPRHTHGPEDAHITIVARGRVRMEVGIMKDGAFLIEETTELSAGGCIDSAPGVYHQFVATTDDARIFNIVSKLAKDSSAPNTAR